MSLRVVSRYLVCALLCLSSLSSAQAAEWGAIDALVDQGKFGPAKKELNKIISGQPSDQDLATALAKMASLLENEGKNEEAASFLTTAKKPKGAAEKALLDLYTAQMVFSYMSRYSWEIGQREQTLATNPKVLRSMSKSDLYAAALGHYDDAWSARSTLENKKITAFKNLITPNTYPDGMRGTLRDAVSYKAIEALQDTSYWTPAESNGLSIVPLDSILAGDLKALGITKDISLADGRFHPLFRMAYVTEDLATWNADRDNDAGALQARIALHTALFDLFHPSKDYEKSIRASLKALLEEHKGIAWAGYGYGQLAKMHQIADEPVTAHTIASACVKNYPSTKGLCAAVKSELERPSLQVSAMSLDGLGKRSIVVQHKNLKTVWFRAYKLNLAARTSTQADADAELLPSTEDSENLLKRKADVAWQVALPATTDLREHVTHVTPPFSAKGLYAVIASAREDFGTKKNELLMFSMTVSNLVILTEPMTGTPRAATVTVVDGEDGKPVNGAVVTLYSHDPYSDDNVRKKLSEATTGPDGQVKIAADNEYNSLYLTARKGADISLRESPDTGYRAGQPPVKQTLIYTDRGAYRPGQKILWKVIAFGGNRGSGNFKIAPNQKFTVSLHDINSQKISSKSVTSNAFGSASGEFTIPEGRPLGQWYISSSFGHSSQQIVVEEYKRPTFEVSFKDTSDEYRVNQKVEIAGEARYHFGAPLTEGKASFKVERQPRYPSWFSFLYWRNPPSVTSEIVASGDVKISPDGSFKIAFVPKVKEATNSYEMATTYSYKISADVTDPGGETRSQSTEIVAGHVTVQADLNKVPSVCFDPTSCRLQVSRQLLSGTGAEGVGDVEVIALTAPKEVLAPADIPIDMSSQPNDSAEPRKPLPGDLLRPRGEPNFSVESYLASWKLGKIVAKQNIKHGKDGLGEVTTPALEAGAYKLVYTTKDAGGREYKAWKYFIAAKQGAATLKIPLVLAVDRDSQEVGKKIRLFVHNGSTSTQSIKLYRQNKNFRDLKVPAGSHVIEIPVTPDLRGGFSVAVQVVRDFQTIRLTEDIFVPWSDKKLDVSFERLRDVMRPGAKETVTIRVKGANASARVAEVLAFMYDKSLDAVQPNNVQNPLSLFPNLIGASYVGSNLRTTEGQELDTDGFYEQTDVRIPTTDLLVGIGTPARQEAYGGASFRRQALGTGTTMYKRSRARGLEAEDSAMDAEAADGVMALAEAAPAQMTSAAPAAAGLPSANKQAVVALRENFAETAFFIPHLVTKADGSVTATFSLPDSLTAWHVWAVAFMKDFSSGLTTQEIRTAKDLMARLYTPRFVREGDQLTMRVTINNNSKEPLSGPVKVLIRDADTNADLGPSWTLALDRSSVTVPTGSAAVVNASVKVPPGIRTIKVEAQVTSGSISDGEVRTIPVLPGRMHLVQSRFIALQPGERETAVFDDLKASTDKTRINDKMIVTVDGQLFFSMLKAVPYLVTYPYECSEQTLNRFLSAGIMSAIFEANPNLKKAAASFAARDRQYEPWTKSDPNQRMQLEESPWLRDAQGGPGSDDAALINLLKPDVAVAIKTKALNDLKKMQTSSGGFSWFPGGAPSPYMTLYIVYGFAKAKEFGIKIPDDMIARAWRYLAGQYKVLWIKKDLEQGLHTDYFTFLNFTASAFAPESGVARVLKDSDREKMLAYSLKHWKKMSPYLQLMVSLTAHRMGESEKADMVLESVLDRAQTSKEGGTSWAPEERSWLWYNDSTEMHAFALRVLSEMKNDSKLIPGIIHWIFLDKKLNQWKSTKATAEVIYSVATHLKRTAGTAADERIDVAVGAVKKTFNFRQDEYKGRQQLTIKGADISPASAQITAKSESKSLAFVSTTWHYSTEVLPDSGRGDFFTVDRKYFIRKASTGSMTLKPLTANEPVSVGDEVEVQISIKNKHQAEYVHLRDPRPSGFEPVSMTSGYKWDLGISWYEEIRDNGTNFFFDWLPNGEYTFKYRLRAANAGTFKSMPAEIQSLYAPDFNAFSAGQMIRVAK